MRLGKGKGLIGKNTWKAGWISPKGTIHVTTKDNHFWLFKEVTGKDFYDYNDVADVFGEGWVRLVNGKYGWGMDEGTLGVEVQYSHYERVRNEIQNFIPFYKYFNLVVFDIIQPSGRYKIIRMKLKIEEEVGFSLLNNPYRCGCKHGRLF